MWQDSNVQGWSARRLGCLGEEALGYALARYTQERGERSPRWWRYLATNVLSFAEEAEFFLSRENPAAPDLSRYPDPRAARTGRQPRLAAIDLRLPHAFYDAVRRSTCGAG